MDFQLSEEQLQLRKMVRDFAQSEIAPNIMKWDEPGTFPLELYKELGKLGLMGTIFPTEYGGAGMGYVEYVIAVEELSARRWLRRHHRGRAHLAVHQPHLSGRQRGAEAEIPSQARQRASAWAPGRSPSPARVPMPVARAAPPSARATSGC